MKRKELQAKLLFYILTNKGTSDRYEISGQYAYSYSDLLQYLAVYYIDEYGEIYESFFQHDSELEALPLKNFFKCSDRVKMNKIRQYVRDYIY